MGIAVRFPAFSLALASKIKGETKGKMNRVNRAMLVSAAAKSVLAVPWYPGRNRDLPLIRQSINDNADAYRKNGWTCRDFDQDSMVRSVQAEVIRNHLAA